MSLRSKLIWVYHTDEVKYSAKMTIVTQNHFKLGLSR